MNVTKLMQPGKEKGVSVPLRGSGDESSDKCRAYMSTKEFPSPCGVVVMNHELVKSFTPRTMPLVSVPLRGSGDESRQSVSQAHQARDVSVPLRGSGDESRRDDRHDPALESSVSVPLRGSGDESGRSDRASPTAQKFPSPCGVVVMNLR